MTGAHEAAVTFHCRLITVGPDCVGVGAGVGAVGEFEQPIANSKMSPQNVRVTIASHLAGARDVANSYSDVVPRWNGSNQRECEMRS